MFKLNPPWRGLPIAINPGKQVVYHATALKNWERISKRGIRPRKLPSVLAKEVELTRGIYVGGLSFIRDFAEGEADSMIDLGEADSPVDMAIIEISVPMNVNLIQDPNFPGEESYIVNTVVYPKDVRLREVVTYP